MRIPALNPAGIRNENEKESPVPTHMQDGTGVSNSHPISILIIVSLVYPEMVSAANHWEL